MKNINKFSTAFYILLLTLSIFVSNINSQTKPETLTNAKIIELIRLGLSEDIIIEKIRQSECKCDTSTNGLAKLKAAKVSDEIIMAMLNGYSDSTTENPGSSYGNADVQSNTATISSAESKALGKIAEPGIYLFENDEMKQIEPSIFSGSKMNPLMSTLTYGVKKTKYKAKVRGKSANLQTSDSSPIFYFVFNPEYKRSGATMAGLFWGMPATSPAEFLLVEMQVKDNSRRAVLGEFGVWTGVSMGARDKDVREYSFEKIKPGIYKVTPKENLKAGEYCFYFGNNVTGIGIAGGKIFDFGVVN